MFSLPLNKNKLIVPPSLSMEIHSWWDLKEETMKKFIDYLEMLQNEANTSLSLNPKIKNAKNVLVSKPQNDFDYLNNYFYYIHNNNQSEGDKLIPKILRAIKKGRTVGTIPSLWTIYGGQSWAGNKEEFIELHKKLIDEHQKQNKKGA